MERVILHADLNSCYASIEILHQPHLRRKPVAVGGDVQQRHGIILAKNDIAKQYGIQTGEALWQAQQKCRDLVILPPNFPLYLRFSKMAREIYCDYTDLTEPFGIDESWLDVSGSTHLYGSGAHIANSIRMRIKAELGVTVSVGVSFNKIFAKLGSDMKKPDAVTVITKENFRQTVWPLPAGDLLYVGPSTQRRLHSCGVDTIGQIAQEPPAHLRRLLGKWGDVLWQFANGNDDSPVSPHNAEPAIKSIGNSVTTPRDLTCREDVKMIVYMLAESVAMRMREQGFQCRTVALSVRDAALLSFERQGALHKPSCLSSEIARKALALFDREMQQNKSIRSIGIRASDFMQGDAPIQLDLFSDETARERQKHVENTVDVLRRRYGNQIIGRAVLLQDTRLTGMDPKTEHTIHPHSYF